MLEKTIKIYIPVLVCFIYVFSCKENNKYPLLFDMEKVEESHFISQNSEHVSNSLSQSLDYAKSGKFSSKIDAKNPYALSYVFKNLKKGNELIISVWEKNGFSRGYLKLVGEEKNILAITRSRQKETESQWVLITFSFLLDEDFEQIKFFIHNEKILPAYYDDLKIEVFNKSRRPVFKKENLGIQIESKDLDKLFKYREKAIQNGVIGKSLKKYFSGIMVYNNEEISIKIRLKGDWIDHLSGDKWSFRIKILGDKYFKGMKTFSIQHPKTRSFLKEWLIHKIFRDENILTTRYGFITASLNGNNLGIYAYEEHFSKELLKDNNKTEAPILKFNEEGVWETRINNPKNKKLYPFFEASEIIPFQKNKILSSDTLKQDFKKGFKLMTKYKEFNENLEDIFNLNHTAKLYALYDIGKIRHSYHWHNQRFYYNPKENELEHIAFDCYAGIEEGIEDIIYGYSDTNSSDFKMTYLSKQFFNNDVFVSSYKKFLHKFSKVNYLNSTLGKYKASCDSLNTILKYEFPNYEFDIHYLIDNAKAVRELLPSYISNHDFVLKPFVYDYASIENNYFPSIGIKANKYINRENELVLNIKNFHLDTVYLIGYSKGKKSNELVKFKDSILLSPFQTKGESIEIKINRDADFIFFKPQNTKKLEVKNIINKNNLIIDF
tara:strand:- start:9171 stop:11162 length:1992 start_codon:yes stop_codon:yes gene_type:complete